MAAARLRSFSASSYCARSSFVSLIAVGGRRSMGGGADGGVPAGASNREVLRSLLKAKN